MLNLISKIVALMLLPILVFAAEVATNAEDEVGIPRDNDDSYVFIKNGERSEEGDKNILPFKVFTKVNLQQLSVPKCSDVPINIDKCKTAVCYEELAFGKVYRKVIGLVGKSCKYIERSKDFGGINCLIPQEQTKAIEGNLEKLFESLYNNKIILSPQEVDELQKVYSQYCKVVLGSDMQDVVTINGKKEAKSDFIELFQVKEDENKKLKAKGKATSAKYINKGSGTQASAKAAFQSIMFKQEDMDAILEIVQGIANPIFSQKTSSSGAGVAGQGSNLISFYLNSIIYISQSDWTVWLNSYKLSTNTSGSAVSVVKVMPQEAEFKWIANNLDKASPSWQTKVEQIDANSFVSKTLNIKIKRETEQMSAIYFTLKPNQTFVLQNLSIIEGKIQ